MSIKQILDFPRFTHLHIYTDNVFELRNRAVHENDRTGSVKTKQPITNQRNHTRPLKLSKIWFSIVPLCFEDHTRASTLNNE